MFGSSASGLHPEQRRSPRFPFDSLVRVTASRRGEEAQVWGRSTDLCREGCGSLAADLAEEGFCAYVIDIRGYGQSTRPPEMEEPPQNHLPVVRSVEAVRDIDAAVDLIRRRTGASRVSLFGWATGGQWAGYYATQHSEKL